MNSLKRTFVNFFSSLKTKVIACCVYLFKYFFYRKKPRIQSNYKKSNLAIKETPKRDVNYSDYLKSQQHSWPMFGRRQL